MHGGHGQSSAAMCTHTHACIHMDMHVHTRANKCNVLKCELAMAMVVNQTAHSDAQAGTTPQVQQHTRMHCEHVAFLHSSTRKLPAKGCSRYTQMHAGWMESVSKATITNKPCSMFAQARAQSKTCTACIRQKCTFKCFQTRELKTDSVVQTPAAVNSHARGASADQNPKTQASITHALQKLTAGCVWYHLPIPTLRPMQHSTAHPAPQYTTPTYIQQDVLVHADITAWLLSPTLATMCETASANASPLSWLAPGKYGAPSPPPQRCIQQYTMHEHGSVQIIDVTNGPLS